MTENDWQGPLAVGTKEALRAVRAGRATQVHIATDCEPRVVRELVEACENAQVPIRREYTRVQLGGACRLKVKAAAVAVLQSTR